MKSRKAKAKPGQLELLNRFTAEIREKDKERVIFFRQLGEIGDRYSWKGIHGRDNKYGNKSQRTKNNSVSHAGVSVLSQDVHRSVVPFPDVWMKAVQKVNYYQTLILSRKH